MKHFLAVMLYVLSVLPGFAQIESNRHGCATTDNVPVNHPPPYKTINTVDYGAPEDEDVIRVALIFVRFKNEDRNGHDVDNGNWKATNSGPTFANTLLSSEREGTGQTDWWNFYDPETESLSSWFCEVSKGKMHVIGDVYTVQLAHDYTYYVDYEGPNYREKEAELNAEIFDYLDQVLNVDWRPYDRWGHDPQTGEFYYNDEGDGKLDMVFRIFRYNYGGIFSYDYSGWAKLGYIGTFGNEEYSLNWNKEVSGKEPDDLNYPYSGSGLTIIGNGASGILDKNGTLARLTHEFGHWIFGTNHSYYGRMGGGGEYFLDPWERIKLDYLSSSDIEIFSTTDEFKNITLYDYSSRVSNVKSLIKIDLTQSENFLISNRRRVSKWDIASSGDSLLGNPFKPIDPENYGYGKGIYIYHNNEDWSVYSYPNLGMDIECADGLWSWKTGGFQAPNWNSAQNFLPIMERITPFRVVNDIGENGIILYPNGVAYYKDGLNITAEENGFHCVDNNGNPFRCVLPKYFSAGKEGSPGTDKLFTNDITTWTSNEVAGDRYDAWQEGEIFSPYSSPSSYNWQHVNSNIFMWIENVDEQNNTANIKIYRASTNGGSQWNLSNVLEATPPTKPMGIKEEECVFSNGHYRPKISWIHNTEPDMVRGGGLLPENKRYKIYRSVAADMSSVPLDAFRNPENVYTHIATVDIPPNVNPTFIDNELISGCALPDGPCPPNCWILYPVRYRVQAVDKFDDVSVLSDFAHTTAIRTVSGDPGGEEEGGDNTGYDGEVPTVFNLFQNYPNPFNPTTNIQYDIPNDVFVSIKVYDMLGREVADLVNEVKNAGRYIVGFNGSNLTSGIYYYKIKAGNFEQTRRMVLIK